MQEGAWLEEVGWHPPATRIIKKGPLFISFQLWENGKPPQGEFQRKGETCSVVALHFEAVAVSLEWRRIHWQGFEFEKTGRGIEKPLTTPPHAFQLGLQNLSAQNLETTLAELIWIHQISHTLKESEG